MISYNCGVLNCGSGKCIHKLLDEHCPHCNFKMVEVITTKFRFCSNPDHQHSCDYEYDALEQAQNEAKN
jgi:hypothetical protein